VVAYVGVQPGDITAGTTTGAVPFVVVEDAQYVIEAEGEETDVRGARDGAAAIVTLAPPNPSTLEGRVDGVPQLRRLGANGNPSTWSLTIRLSRSPDDTSIGRSARVDIRADSRTEAVVAPTPAVFRLNGADTLLVSDKAGGWRTFTVTLGLSDDYVTELLQGPPPGTAVLVGSSDRLRAVATAMLAPP
jgi:hypothetical protein